MRADRLVATLLLLQSRGKVTATELATELEVSVRTARRDLEALAMSGVPVYATRGRGGGWRLVGGARTDLTGFTATEARALLLAVSAGGVAIGSAGSGLATALPKLVQALPESFRADVAEAASRVLIDPDRWLGPVAVGDPGDGEILERLRDAVTAGQQIDLGYRRPDQQAATVRRVHPLGLVSKAAVWYLVGMTGSGRRTYRVSRVVSVVPTGLAVERPEGFDLDEAWRSIITDFGSRMVEDAPVAEAVAEEWVPLALARVPGVVADVVGESGDGRLLLRIRGAGRARLVQVLAGLDPGIEVTGPGEVRAALADLGRRLSARYGATPGI